MAKIFTDDEIRFLSANPNVRVITPKRLSLTYEFRCQLYDAWCAGGRAAIRSTLEAGGIPYKMLGRHGIDHLCFNFSKSPPVNCSGKVVSVRKHPNTQEETEMLVSSGIFVRRGNSISFSDEFVSYVSCHYPDVTVESALKERGIDLSVVGYQRIHTLKKRIENGSDRSSNGYDDNLVSTLKTNRFVSYISPKQLRLSKLFYQTACLYSRLDINLILNAFGIPSEQLSYGVKQSISNKLKSWKEKAEPIQADDEIICIQGKLTDLLIPLLEKEITSFIAFCEPHARRQLFFDIKDECHESGLSRVLKQLDIPRSTFYGILKKNTYGNTFEQQKEKDRETAEKIRKIIAYKGYRKGTRCVSMMSLTLTGEFISRRRAQRIMRKEKLLCTIRKVHPGTAEQKKLLKENKKENVVKRTFRLHRPYDLVFTDVTYIRYGSDKTAYLSPVLDSCGEVISYAVSECQDLSMAFEMLDNIRENTVHEGTVFHSDQGSLYLSDSFQDRLQNMGLVQSMSRRGNCWDNAAMESFFGHLKDYCDFTACSTPEDVRKTIDDYIDYYNNERPQWTRKKMTPACYAEYMKNMSDEEFNAYLSRERETYKAMIMKSLEKTDKHREHLCSVLTSLM